MKYIENKMWVPSLGLILLVFSFILMINGYLAGSQTFEAQESFYGITFLNESFLTFKKFELIAYAVAIVILIHSYVTFSEDFPTQMVRYSWMFTGLSVIAIVFFYNTPVRFLSDELFTNSLGNLVLDTIYNVVLSAFWMWFFKKPEVIEVFEGE